MRKRVYPLYKIDEPANNLEFTYQVLEKAGGTLFEKFCRAIPAEMVDLLQEWHLKDFPSLLEYMRKRQYDIYNNRGNITADEAVLMLKRMESLGVINSHNRLLEFILTSSNLNKAILNRAPSHHKFFCPVCGKVYALEWFVWHINREHIKLSIKPKYLFKCPLCSTRAKASRLVSHLSGNHAREMYPVYAVVQATLNEKNTKKQPTIILPSVDKLALPPASNTLSPVRDRTLKQQTYKPTRLTHLREFRPLHQTPRLKRVKISNEIGDRRYFVSQASLVKTERASRIHAEVLGILRDYLATAGVEIFETFLIDAFAEFQGSNIFEVKSIDSSNEKSQIRHAIAQLYEYRYIYGLRDARLWLVLSRQPEIAWVLEYLVADRNIFVIWAHNGSLAGRSLDALSEMLV